MQDTTDTGRVAAFHEGQRAILERIARDAPLVEILTAIVHLVEAQSDRPIMCSILLVERRAGTPAVVRHGAAPSLPEAFNDAIDGLAIGPMAGSCGAAAYLDQVVEVDDIATHPNWAPYRELALPLGLRACWSSPIRASVGEVLGTFAIYDREPCGATADQHRWVEAATHLASIAIERTRSHEALAQSEARFRQLVDTTFEGVWIVDPQLVTTFANRRMSEMLGVSREALLGHTFVDFVAREQRDAATRILSDSDGEPHELPFLHGSGAQLWAQVAAGPAPVGQRGTVVMVTDVSDRRRAAKALRQSEAELRASFEHAGIGMALIRPGGWPVRVNPAFARFLGYSEDELAKMTFADFTHPGDVDRDLTLYHSLLAGRIDHYGMEKRYIKKSGEVVWGKLTVTLVTDPERAREQSLVIGMIEDIDQKKRLEAQVLRAQRMDGLARLASGIAHDFNNILTAIHGFTRLAVEELGDEHPTTEPILQIERAATRATALVRRILTLSRDVEPQRHTQPLQPIITEATSLLRSTLPKQVRLHVRLADDVPLVRADATQIHQVVMNLATNAAHAMADGGALTVALERVELASPLSESIGPGTWACLSISDSGTGIDESTYERMFEPFFTTKSPTQGTGLGLPMVSAIAKAHEGDVRVRTALGEGSTFEVWLPASAGTSASEATLEPSGAAGRGERILFVDDEPAIARLARRELERAGFRVGSFEQPELALAAFEATPDAFDVVVSDTSMPNLTGIDLARAIRRRRTDLPIVLISGGPLSRDDQSLAGLGIAAVLLKPGALTDLPRTLRRLLGQ